MAEGREGSGIEARPVSHRPNTTISLVIPFKFKKKKKKIENTA